MLLIGCLLLSAATGCRERDIRTQYGYRTGYGASSVNGTSVLSNLFEQAGHRVRSWRLLSPSLEEADVVVWFPEDLGPPGQDVVAWFDERLRYSYDENTYQPEEKKLIIVGRGYDAEELYWRETQALAPAKLKTEFKSRLRQAQNNSVTGSAGGSTGEAYEWFRVDKPGKRTKVTTLAGPWAAGVDPAKATLEHRATLFPDDSFEPLLSDGAGHPLVSEGIYSHESGRDQSESRILVVENGSFLLNAALVNHENRKLAGKVVDWIGEPEKKVVFLESGLNPTISDSDPRVEPPTGFELFRIWPIGAVLAQAAALGIVFAMARFPIFGVPRRLSRPSLTNFGRHVSALGRLLAATRDRAYAKGLLSKYFADSKQD